MLAFGHPYPDRMLADGPEIWWARAADIHGVSAVQRNLDNLLAGWTWILAAHAPAIMLAGLKPFLAGLLTLCRVLLIVRMAPALHVKAAQLQDCSHSSQEAPQEAPRTLEAWSGATLLQY